MKKFIGWRKVGVMILIIAVAIIFRIVDYVNGSEFVDLLKMCAIAFFGANLVSKFTKIKEKL